MTQEEKAKAYDKAKIRMKEFLEEWENCGAVGEALEKAQNVFPELAESEDEKIRKYLITYFSNIDDCASSIKGKDVVAWLEKQGQKPIAIDIDKMVDDYANNNERGNEEFGKPINCMIRAYRQGLTDAYCQENCKGYQETGRCFVDGECEAKKSQRMISAETKEALYDKPTLSEFENALADICRGWIGEEIGWKDYISTNADALLKIAFKKWNDVQCVKKSTEWSEEDENILEAITYTVKNSGYSHCIGVSIKVMIAWLKSLKDRIQPQTWKPSDEQMEALKCAMEDVAKFSKRCGPQVELENEPYYSALHLLYEQLKKLKGE